MAISERFLISSPVQAAIGRKWRALPDDNPRKTNEKKEGAAGQLPRLLAAAGNKAGV